MIVTQMNWLIIVMAFIMFYFIALIRGKWTPEFSKSSLLEEIPIVGYAKMLPRAIPKNLRRWVALTANTSSDFNTLTWMAHFTYLQFETLMLKKYNFQILFSTFWRIPQLPQLLESVTAGKLDFFLGWSFYYLHDKPGLMTFFHIFFL